MSRYSRDCGVRDCADRGRHEHKGALVVGEEVVLVVARSDAPGPCWTNPHGRISHLNRDGTMAVDLTDGQLILLRPGDCKRARDWEPPRARAPKAEARPAVIDGTELTLFEE